MKVESSGVCKGKTIAPTTDFRMPREEREPLNRWKGRSS